MSGVPLVVFGLYNILLALTRVNWHRSNSEGKAEHNQMQETNQIQKTHYKDMHTLKMTLSCLLDQYQFYM